MSDAIWLAVALAGAAGGVLVGFGAHAARRRWGQAPRILIVLVVVAALVWTWTRGPGPWGTWCIGLAVSTGATMTALEWRRQASRRQA